VGEPRPKSPGEGGSGELTQLYIYGRTYIFIAGDYKSPSRWLNERRGRVKGLVVDENTEKQ